MKLKCALIVFLQLILPQIVFAQKIDIDLRYSAILTAGVDIYQTNNFNKYGLRETWNPAAKFLLDQGATVFTVLNNRKLGCPGIPIAVISFKF